MRRCYDLIIMGAGGAGLTAALRASELGVRRIAVVEKNQFTGGNSNFPTGIISLNSVHQEAQGVPCRPDAVYKQVMEDLQWTADARIVRRYLMNTGRFVDWVIEKNLGTPVFGVGKDNITGSFSLRTAIEGRQPNFGSVVCRVFTDLCRNQGVLGSQVVEVRVEQGTVTGVQAVVNGKTVTTGCRAVLLAAGGVTGSVAALHKYFPDVYEADDYRSSFSLTSNVGDGIEVAKRAGAKTGHGMSIFTVGPALHDDYVIGMSQSNPRCLWVNKQGERFFNEEKAAWASKALLEQPGKIIYVIYDSTTKDLIKRELQEHPVLRMRGFSAESLEQHYKEFGSRTGKAAAVSPYSELASFAGIPEQALTRTIQAYNAACDSGRDDLLCKQAMYLNPVRKPPFYISESTHFYDSSQGGIAINDRTEVLTPEGCRIPGLYAAGDNASGFVSRYAYAPQGAGFTWAFNSGFLAAEQIAAYLTGTEKI